MIITLQTVKKLIATQFPEYRNRPIEQIKFSGIDNRTFRLGDTMLIRLPSAEGYAAQVKKEQTWLPKLASHLSIKIPEPLHMGKPCGNYPWHWSIYKWITGISANQINLSSNQLEKIAHEIAKFIKELHLISTKNAPAGGLHNYYRGCHISVYDKDARADIEKLKNVIDTSKALAMWEKAISSKWQSDPVWTHGDLASGNIIINNNHQLEAVIDFGCMSIGDPACDLVIAWTFFENESREIFINQVNMDSNTWSRAKGWGLWKANFELAKIKDKSSKKSLEKMRIINSILNKE